MFACALCLLPAAGIPSPGECWPQPAPSQERGVTNLRTEGEGLQGNTLPLQVVGAAGQTRAGCWLREPSSESSPGSKLSRESERTCVRSAVRSKKSILWSQAQNVSGSLKPREVYWRSEGRIKNGRKIRQIRLRRGRNSGSTRGSQQQGLCQLHPCSVSVSGIQLRLQGEDVLGLTGHGHHD